MPVEGRPRALGVGPQGGDDAIQPSRLSQRRHLPEAQQRPVPDLAALAHGLHQRQVLVGLVAPLPACRLHEHSLAISAVFDEVVDVSPLHRRFQTDLETESPWSMSCKVPKMILNPSNSRLRDRPRFLDRFRPHPSALSPLERVGPNRLRGDQTEGRRSLPAAPLTRRWPGPDHVRRAD